MEKKFTKGPWVAEIFDNPFDPKNKFGIDIKGVSDPDEYEWVASVHRQFKGKENGEANARLIAAAPEMFELMEEFCLRVEKGEVRSTKTYNKFKQLLTSITQQP